MQCIATRDNLLQDEQGVKLYGLSPQVACLQGPVSDLAHFRVLGVINKVLLVYDSHSQTTCVMKVGTMFLMCLSHVRSVYAAQA